MIRAIVIDDEKWARETIVGMGKRMIPDFDIVAEAFSVESGYTAIGKHKPDLVLLDIHLPDGSGFELLGKFPGFVPFKVVFITAYEEYAIKAFKFSALDYLLKPIDPEDFVKSIQRVRHQITLERFNQGLRDLMTYYNPGSSANPGNTIVLRTQSQVYRLSSAEIVRMESQNTHTFIFLITGAMLKVSKTLNKLEDLTHENDFLRVHQTHLVNSKYVKGYLSKESVLVMADNSHIPVSTRKRAMVSAYFSNL